MSILRRNKPPKGFEKIIADMEDPEVKDRIKEIRREMEIELMDSPSLLNPDAPINSAGRKAESLIEDLKDIYSQMVTLKREKGDLLRENSKLNTEVGKLKDGYITHINDFLSSSMNKPVEKRSVIKEFIRDFVEGLNLDLPNNLKKLLLHFDDEKLEIPAPTPTSTIVKVEPGGINIQQAKYVKK